MSNIDKIRQEIERLLKEYKPVVAGVDELTGAHIILAKLLAFIDSLPEETKDAEEAAARYERENRQSILSSVDIVNAFMDGAKWQKEQDEDWLNEELIKAHLNGVMTGDRIARESLPMPEDTVIFQKGVAEGRRLEREDNNKALAEMYGYEGGTESPLVKITFTIPKGQVKNLMPIKQGDVFGIENLTNKEGRR